MRLIFKGYGQNGILLLDNCENSIDLKYRTLVI